MLSIKNVEFQNFLMVLFVALSRSTGHLCLIHPRTGGMIKPTKCLIVPRIGAAAPGVPCDTPAAVAYPSGGEVTHDLS
jgi:hypothetical protein